MKIIHSLISLLTLSFYKCWCSTLFFTESGRKDIDDLDSQGKKLIFCLWHDELFPLAHIKKKQMKVVALVSRSKDGEYLARLLSALGLKIARGSSSRGGLVALRKIAHIIKHENYHCCLTIDGPKGPRHEPKTGCIYLAYHGEGYIAPIRLIMNKSKKFSSWDKFQLPLPFSKVHIVYAKPYPIKSPFLTSEFLEEQRVLLKKTLDSLSVNSSGC